MAETREDAGHLAVYRLADPPAIGEPGGRQKEKSNKDDGKPPHGYTRHKPPQLRTAREPPHRGAEDRSQRLRCRKRQISGQGWRLGAAVGLERLPRNPTVLTWAIPSAASSPAKLSPQQVSQSHRTYLGNSEYDVVAGEFLLGDVIVAIPPYLPGQFRVCQVEAAGAQANTAGESQSHRTYLGNSEILDLVVLLSDPQPSRNPTVLTWAIPRMSEQIRRRQANLVAIPPYLPGQFRGPLFRQGPSNWSRQVAIPPYLPGQFRATASTSPPASTWCCTTGRNPTVLTWAIPRAAPATHCTTDL